MLGGGGATGWWWRCSTSSDGLQPPAALLTPATPAPARSERAASRQRWSRWSKSSTLRPFPPQTPAELAFRMPRRAAATTAAAHTSVLPHGPQRYRVNIFRKSATLPAWFWECWYCRCCRCTCCCCAWGTCWVCGCCWMYPTVLCCGRLVCKNVDVVPPCTWFICG